MIWFRPATRRVAAESFHLLRQNDDARLRIRLSEVCPRHRSDPPHGRRRHRRALREVRHGRIAAAQHVHGRVQQTREHVAAVGFTFRGRVRLRKTARVVRALMLNRRGAEDTERCLNTESRFMQQTAIIGINCSTLPNSWIGKASVSSALHGLKTPIISMTERFGFGFNQMQSYARR